MLRDRLVVGIEKTKKLVRQKEAVHEQQSPHPMRLGTRLQSQLLDTPLFWTQSTAEHRCGVPGGVRELAEDTSVELQITTKAGRAAPI